MNFGPLIPQEIEGIVSFLQQYNIPFEIHFNEEGAKSELAPSPSNNLQATELRTRTYLAQHFYIEVPDEFLINNPTVEAQIIKYITKDDFEESPRQNEDNIIPIHEEELLRRKSVRLKWVQRLFALLFLGFMLYSLLYSVFK
jgi:hypothetical protein